MLLKLINKFHTRDPFEIASSLGIIVLYERLGTINGYYHTAYRQKFIHINCDLPYYRQLFTMAHELAHAVLHPKSNTPFLTEYTLFSVNKLEREANKFAVNLLICDSDLKNYVINDYTISQIASIYGLPTELIELRLETFSM